MLTITFSQRQDVSTYVNLPAEPTAVQTELMRHVLGVCVTLDGLDFTVPVSNHLHWGSKLEIVFDILY